MIKLLFIVNINEKDTVSLISFNDKSIGKLFKSNANYSYSISLSKKSYDRRHPIGVKMRDDGVIEELLRVDNDIVNEIIETEDITIKVFFLGHDGIYYLNKKSLEYESIRKKLNDSLKHKKRIWFIAEKSRLTLLNVLMFEEMHIREKK